VNELYQGVRTLGREREAEGDGLSAAVRFPLELRSPAGCVVPPSFGEPSGPEPITVFDASPVNFAAW
jgi:hypothetical protein